MSGSSSVPVPTLGPTGYETPSEPAILAGTQEDMNAAFGGRLNPALNTPQGQLASSLTAIIAAVYDQFLLLTNQVDPSYSAGRMQDAIGRIYFIERLPALPTTVVATCAGLVGVQIPVGALAKAQDGSTYTCTQAGEIGPTGEVDLTFSNLTTGPIDCPATTLDEIYQSIEGWESITNDASGTPGRAVETRAAFEARRSASVAKNAVASVSAIYGAVIEVEDVLDAYVIDNPTASPVVLDGVTVPAYGLFVCVAGGAAADVAEAIWRKKPPGCPMAGSTTEIVEDTQTGYAPPYPQYSISFQIAATQTFTALVTIRNSPQVPNTASTLIQEAMLACFTGADGGLGARIGSEWFASRFYSAIALLGSWASIVSIKIGSSADPAAAFTASIASTTMTVSAVSSGTLAVGQTVMGDDIPEGVRIASLGTGAGGTGTYILNLPQTISSEAMISVASDEDSVEIGVAHVPSLAANNISIVLV